MIRVHILAFALLFVGLAVPAQHNRDRDPLSDAEIDKLREAGSDPDYKIKLFVEFTALRIQWVEKLPKENPLTHDIIPLSPAEALHDFNGLLGEVDANIDMYNRQRYDIRKSLKLAMTSEQQWIEKAKAYQTDLSLLSKDSIMQHRCSLELKDTMDVLNENLENQKDVLEEQNQLAEERAKDKKKKK